MFDIILGNVFDDWLECFKRVLCIGDIYDIVYLIDRFGFVRVILVVLGFYYIGVS